MNPQLENLLKALAQSGDPTVGRAATEFMDHIKAEEEAAAAGNPEAVSQGAPAILPPASGGLTAVDYITTPPPQEPSPWVPPDENWDTAPKKSPANTLNGQKEAICRMCRHLLPTSKYKAITVNSQGNILFAYAGKEQGEKEYEAARVVKEILPPLLNIAPAEIAKAENPLAYCANKFAETHPGILPDEVFDTLLAGTAAPAAPDTKKSYLLTGARRFKEKKGTRQFTLVGEIKHARKSTVILLLLHEGTLHYIAQSEAARDLEEIK